MVPPGWQIISKIAKLMPRHMNETSWISLVNLYIKQKNETKPEFKDDALESLVQKGCIAVNPLLFLRKNKELPTLCGVYCAYVHASSTLENLKMTYTRLLEQGVRSFSIFMNITDASIMTIFSQLEALSQNSLTDGPPIIITIWCDVHNVKLHDNVVAESELDSLKLASTKKITTDSENKHKQDGYQCRLTVGIVIPKLFFEYVSQNRNWTIFGNETSFKLSSLHCDNYSKQYQSFEIQSKPEQQVSSHALLSTIVRACVASRTKYLIHLRDACQSLQSAKAGAVAIWNSEVQTCPIFPNHLGEVPLVATGNVTLQFAAFVNMERCQALSIKANTCAKSAYTLLRLVLEDHYDDAKLFASEGENDLSLNNAVVSLSSAVGLIGLHDSIGYYDDDPTSEVVTRPVLSSDIEQAAAPIIRDSLLVFPMTGSIASILWQVSQGFWTSHIPYTLHPSFHNNPIIAPCGSFAKYIISNQVNLNVLEDVKEAAKKYSELFSQKANAKLLSTRTEAQIHQIRKLCNTFYSTTSMPLVITHEDAIGFHDASIFLKFLLEVVIKNANNDCPVLLPEIRTSATDLSHALERRVNNEPSSVTRLLRSCLKRKRSSSLSALEKADAFLQSLATKLNFVREAANQPLPVFAFNLIETLLSLKFEEMS